MVTSGTKLYGYTPSQKHRRGKGPVNMSRGMRRLFQRYSFLLYFTIGVILFYAAGLWIFRGLGVLVVSEVEVSGANVFVNTGDVKTLVEQNVLGTNVFKVSISSLEHNVKNTFLGIKDVHVGRRLPNRIEVAVTEREPIAILYSTKTSQRYLTDSDGYILGTVGDDVRSLPQITYEEDLNVGHFIDESLIPLYLELTSSFEEVNIQASSVSATSDYISFYTVDAIRVLLGTDKSIRASLLLVSELIKQLTLEGSIPKKIDLRFDKVIVE